MGGSYEFSFEKVSRLSGITTQKLVADQVITEREAELIDKGQVKAVRLSTIAYRKRSEGGGDETGRCGFKRSCV